MTRSGKRSRQGGGRGGRGYIAVAALPLMLSRLSADVMSSEIDNFTKQSTQVAECCRSIIAAPQHFRRSHHQAQSILHVSSGIYSNTNSGCSTWPAGHDVANGKTDCNGATFRQLSCSVSIIHAEAVDSSICQRHLSFAINSAYQVVADIVGEYVSQPVECVVKSMCICKCNNNGVVDCIFTNKRSG